MPSSYRKNWWSRVSIGYEITTVKEEMTPLNTCLYVKFQMRMRNEI